MCSTAGFMSEWKKPGREKAEMQILPYDADLFRDAQTDMGASVHQQAFPSFWLDGSVILAGVQECKGLFSRTCTVSLKKKKTVPPKLRLGASVFE